MGFRNERFKCKKIKCLTAILTRNRGNHHGENQNWRTCLILKQLDLGIDHLMHNSGLKAIQEFHQIIYPNLHHPHQRHRHHDLHHHRRRREHRYSRYPLCKPIFRRDFRIGTYTCLW